MGPIALKIFFIIGLMLGIIVGFEYWGAQVIHRISYRIQGEYIFALSIIAIIPFLIGIFLGRKEYTVTRASAIVILLSNFAFITSAFVLFFTNAYGGHNILENALNPLLFLTTPQIIATTLGWLYGRRGLNSDFG